MQKCPNVKMPICQSVEMPTLTIYIRNRPQKSANKLNYNMIRNTNPKIFYKVCKYFIKLGWRINLIGDDYSNLVSKLNNHKNIIFAEKYNLNKKLFDIFSMTTSKLNITTQGGVNNLGFYSHMINVNILHMVIKQKIEVAV